MRHRVRLGLLVAVVMAVLAVAGVAMASTSGSKAASPIKIGTP